jgi:hypothetical protein
LSPSLILVVGFALRFHGDPAWFLHFGYGSRERPLALRILGDNLITPYEDGHDGPRFWLLSRDPFLLRPGEASAYLDRPAYRAQRIAYPILAAPWRLGGEHTLLWGLIVTNLAVVFAGSWVAVLLARKLGAPERASLAYGLNPAVISAVLLDTADAMMITFLLFALLAGLRRRWGWFAFGATIACLAKEQALLGVGTALLLWPGVPWRVRVRSLALPLTAVGAWALYVRWRLDWPAADIQEFAPPLWGYLDAYRRGWRYFGNWADTLVAVALWPLAAVVVGAWWRRRSPMLAAALPSALIVPFLSAQVVDLAHNALRAVGPALTLLPLDLYARHRPPR